ncbi:hypothetical protein GQ600_3164 [Phytophthora cactorum]|nr:hypothetical protein GQ600_3164 [Phytophthora cactorum]
MINFRLTVTRLDIAATVVVALGRPVRHKSPLRLVMPRSTSTLSPMSASDLLPVDEKFNTTIDSGNTAWMLKSSASAYIKHHDDTGMPQLRRYLRLSRIVQHVPVIDPPLLPYAVHHDHSCGGIVGRKEFGTSCCLCPLGVHGVRPARLLDMAPQTRTSPWAGRQSEITRLRRTNLTHDSSSFGALIAAIASREA